MGIFSSEQHVAKRAQSENGVCKQCQLSIIKNAELIRYFKNEQIFQLFIVEDDIGVKWS